MSSVTRRESQHPASTDLEVPLAGADGVPPRVSANTAARTSTGCGKTEATARGTQGNQVEAYRGSVELSCPQSPRMPPAATGGEGGVTVGQLALGGARTADAARAEATYADIQASLKTDWKDWIISDADRHRVHEQLEKLSPADYRRTLERMEQDRLLGKYLDLERMSPEASKAFLAQAERKSYVTSQPGQKAPRAACDPPDVPTTYRNDAGLPGSVRELVHESNRMAKRTYHDAYTAYVNRYSEQVMRAKSLLDIRSLGEPVAFRKVSDGLVHPHPDSERFRRSWSRVPGNDMRDDAYEAVSKRMAQLQGRLEPGSFWFKVDVGFKAELFKGVSATGGVEVLVTQAGEAKWAPKGGAELAGKGLKASAEFADSGEPKLSVGLEHTPKSLEKNDPMTVGSSVDSEGAVRMDLPAGARLGSYSEVNPNQGTYGGGVGLGHKLGEEGEVKVELGFGMQGARPERARDVASKASGTLFGRVPELDQGLAWKDLPAERRALMERDGWNSEEWTKALRRQGT